MSTVTEVNAPATDATTSEVSAVYSALYSGGT